jgi:hypothetical protein
MTTFQLAAAGVFVVLLLVAYRNELLSLVRRTAKSGRSLSTDTEPSIAVTIVNDLISVTELRDKLAAENCPEGVEACTALLRVIVEHTKKPVA